MLVVSKSRYEREIGKLKEENLIGRITIDEKTDRILKMSKDIEELGLKLRKSNARLGGYQSNLTKSKSLIESLRIDNENYEKQLEELKKENIEHSENNKVLATEILKLRGIIENQNDIISKKMRKVPTVTDIVNYDRKQPIKK